ncbi:ABC transporter ATP-binding protein [Candidatus Uhrbacteria bacterium]|nr:ABC transporter ATP-binding protein [Candidatus Uhrbacteria bacterium]
MATPTLELKNVTKKFGDLTAVKQLSLHVHPGEIYGLIGPNGSGKTTTIKMIAGLYRPTKGSLKVAGIDTGEGPIAAKRLVGYVPDDPVAYGRLTGREFLEFVGELYGMERDRRDRAIEKLLADYRLGVLADGLFELYSRGNKQKISFIAALLHEPKLLLVDEPMVGLDPESARITERLLQAFADRGGTVLLSTHTLSVAEDVCHRLGILKEGELVEEGRISQLKTAAGMDRGSLTDIYTKIIGGL